jgi:integrase
MTQQNKKDEIKDVQPIRTLDGIEAMKKALKRKQWLKEEVSWQSERNYILFCLGINTGLRVSDLLNLKIKDVKGKKRFIVKEGKTDKPRTIYVNGLYEELNAYIKTLKGTEWLFPSRKGDKAISRIQAYRALNKASEYAGLESVGTHTMRKTFGYWYYKKTLDIVSLQKILNHSHPAITLEYIGITAEQIEDSLKDFNL